MDTISKGQIVKWIPITHHHHSKAIRPLITKYTLINSSYSGVAVFLANSTSLLPKTKTSKTVVRRGEKGP